MNNRVDVMGSFVSVFSKESALNNIISSASRGDFASVFFANVHMVVTAHWDGDFQVDLNSASMVLPDGAPIAWLMRRAGYRDQRRISGPDLMWDLLKIAEAQGLAVAFVGGTPFCLDGLIANVSEAFPKLRIPYAISPPFRELSLLEIDGIRKEIKNGGATIVFVGLGCPKQEKFISRNLNGIGAVVLGVGAAFDFHANVLKRAPSFMRDLGLEWFYRLLCDPKRLFGRYFKTNSVFLIFLVKNLFRRFWLRT